MDAPPALPAASAPAADDAAYVYSATDIRPRQTREIELCEKASSFDWQYTGAFALGFATSVYLNIAHLKELSPAPVRLIGPVLEGFTWGGTLSGGYLSLPKCDPLFAYGAPPEGNVRAAWPMAAAIAIISGVSAPILDYTFLGPVKVSWAVTERSARVFIAAGFGIFGSLFPYILPPRTWSAAKEIERIRVEGRKDGAAFTYSVTF